MTKMFMGAESFNSPINGWNLREVNDTDSMFYKCYSFTNL